MEAAEDGSDGDERDEKGLPGAAEATEDRDGGEELNDGAPFAPNGGRKGDAATGVAEKGGSEEEAEVAAEDEGDDGDGDGVGEAEGDEYRDLQNFIGGGVEEHTEAGFGTETAGDGAIEEVSDAGPEAPEEGPGEPMVENRNYDEGGEGDAEKGEEVGEPEQSGGP